MREREDKNGGASVVSEEDREGLVVVGKGTAARQISLLPPRWRRSYHTTGNKQNNIQVQTGTKILFINWANFEL